MPGNSKADLRILLLPSLATAGVFRVRSLAREMGNRRRRRDDESGRAYGRYAAVVYGTSCRSLWPDSYPAPRGVSDVEDTVAATVTFQSGALGAIEAFTTIDPAYGFRVMVRGDNGATAGLLESPEGTQGINDVWTFAPGMDERADWEAAETDRPGFLNLMACRLRNSWMRSAMVAHRPSPVGMRAIHSRSFWGSTSRRERASRFG